MKWLWIGFLILFLIVGVIEFFWSAIGIKGGAKLRDLPEPAQTESSTQLEQLYLHLQLNPSHFWSSVTGFKTWKD